MTIIKVIGLLCFTGIQLTSYSRKDMISSESQQ